MGDSETETLWTDFLPSLVDPNLAGVHLVGALLVEMNDQMISSDHRYAAASIPTVTEQEEDQLASLPAAPLPEPHEPHNRPTPPRGTQSGAWIDDCHRGVVRFRLEHHHW